MNAVGVNALEFGGTGELFDIGLIPHNIKLCDVSLVLTTELVWNCQCFLEWLLTCVLLFLSS